MSRYEKYPTYRDSGVEWIGEIPEHWTVWKVTHGFKTIGSGTTPKSDNPEYYEGNTPWITTSELRESKIFDTSQKVSEKALNDYSTLKVYSAGSIAIAMYGATIGRLGILGIDAAVNQACCVFSHPKVFDYLFFYYWLQMRKPILLSLSTGGGQPNLSQDDLKQLKIPTPPLEEQQAIASFLDRKTAEIDELITKKEELLKKLDEKRTALITQAVTKGLDPSVPMKDSGAEWLGEIPKHWVIWKVTHGFNTIGSGTTPKSDNSDFYDGNIPWVTTSELRETVIENTSQKISIDAFQSHSALKIYPAGSIVIAMYGATIGRLGILGVDATVNQACCVFAQPTTFKPRFFYYWLLMRKPILISLSTGGGQPNLSLEDLKNIRIPTPPLEEQQAIAEHIEKKTAIIDRQKTQVTVAIERLKEYRSALITDAVTGKMDVHSIGKKESLSA
jgi:type I restriction enzyme S subunit